ncbi:MAG: tyrosine--tRNA ligase [Candidatus Doudnabacteria bacterium]|nr:tyrosine--tRNA ligase [Candidatus Doudnabacteria bacterium]
MNKNDTIGELLTRGVNEVIDQRHLEEVLNSSNKLRVKLGIDPTGAKLHLGHAVVLRTLRRFQDLGHTVVLIIGDTTALIGDPSGKNETRPQLSAKDIAKNFDTYEQQALKILDKSHLEIRRQSEWFKDFSLADVIREAAMLSAGWIMSHETFRNRIQTGQPLALHELLYPLVQAYDSVAVEADVEIGGLDQKFNLLTGRELMRAHKMKPQDIVLTKYLIGTDGQKMGKSLGNYVALEDEPNDMFGKIMAINDTLILPYFELATTVPMNKVEELGKELTAGTNPRTIKVRLAKEIVTLYHGKNEAEKAAEEFDKVFSKKEKPSEIEEVKVKSKDITSILVETKLAASKSAAKRLLEQNGVKVDDVTADESTIVESGSIIQVGKRNFVKIK